MKIEDLPDYAALCQIRDALWEIGEIRGAAVMVGAGFSRMADRDGSLTPLPPLWSTFSEAMKTALPSSTTNDPLELAQEYKEFLGGAALEALIRRLIPDESWQPSEMHTDLLGLPWQDVLTTNWDTLLERTSPRDPEVVYEIVRNCSDIARTRSPRIVKLHGSLPSNPPFIFTAEDYRTYPREFAPLVNLAQQVLMENELCLIGFSGDDPNFKAWSGWVRDQLGKSARPIRLVGVLDLSTSRRRVLEKLNVTPIDLAPLVDGLHGADRHEAASRKFVDWLWASRPKARHAWEIERQPFVAAPTANKLQTLVDVWKAERYAYPGWIAAPAHHRLWLKSHTISLFSEVKPKFEDALPALKGRFAFELSWRLKVALEPLNGWPGEVAEWAMTTRAAELSIADRVFIADAQLSQARADRDWARFDEFIVRLDAIKLGTQEAAYQRALRARDELDHAEVERLLANVSSQEPIWRLRRVGLLGFLGQGTSAAMEAAGALKALQKRRAKDRKSIELLSLEAWAAFMVKRSHYELGHAGGAEEDEIVRSGRYAAASCDPWSTFQSFEREAVELRDRIAEDARTIEPRFDAGSYRDNSHSIRFVSANGSTVLGNFLQLCDQIGLPSSLGHFDMAGGRARKILEAVPHPGAREIYAAVEHISDYSKGLIDQYFGRLAIANMDPVIVRDLVGKLRRNLEYGESKTHIDKSRWIEFVRVRAEILSRLVMRLDTDEASRLFRWALERLVDVRWRWPAPIG